MLGVDDMAGLLLINVFGSIEIPEGATQLTIETRRNEFYQLVGKCIKEWANVEEKLFELCVFALAAPRKQSAIVYYKSPTIISRLNLVDELLRAILPPRTRKNGGHDHPHVVTWNEVCSAIKDALGERNLLAHAPVREVEAVQTMVPLTGADPFKTLASWLEIIASEGERLKSVSEKKPIRTKDLHAHLTAVELLTKRISVFHGMIAKVPPEAPAPRKSRTT
jgi:hypothetical protein